MSGSLWRQVWWMSAGVTNRVTNRVPVCLNQVPSTLDLSRLGDDVMLDQTCYCFLQNVFIFRPELQVQISMWMSHR